MGSSRKCPKCGVYEWYRVYQYVSKSGKFYYEIVQCSKCGYTERYGYKIHSRGDRTLFHNQ